MAPIYGQMSEQYTEESVVFVKVDGDQAREVLAANNVSAFPTFKVFKAKAEIFSQGGFAQAAIAKSLVDNGAVPVSTKSD